MASDNLSSLQHAHSPHIPRRGAGTGNYASSRYHVRSPGRAGGPIPAAHHASSRSKNPPNALGSTRTPCHHRRSSSSTERICSPSTPSPRNRDGELSSHGSRARSNLRTRACSVVSWPATRESMTSCRVVGVEKLYNIDGGSCLQQRHYYFVHLLQLCSPMLARALP